MQKLHPAYLAGLFDGEGCVGVWAVNNGRKNHPSGSKTYWGIKIFICGCHKPMIAAVHESFGTGSLNSMKRQKLYVRVGEDHRKQDKFGKQGWRWLLSNRKDALKMFELIRPYLLEKAEQVDVAAAFCRGELDGADAANQLKALKLNSTPA